MLPATSTVRATLSLYAFRRTISAKKQNCRSQKGGTKEHRGPQTINTQTSQVHTRRMSAGCSGSGSNAQAITVGGVFGLKRHAEHLADHLGAAAQARAFQKQQVMQSAVLEVTSQEELEALPFHMQGDLSLSTHEAFKKRKQARRDASVVTQLSKWWDAAIATARLSQPGVNSISYEVYKNIYHSISMRLLHDSYDEDEAEVEAREEWAKDSLTSTSSTSLSYTN